MSSSAWLLGCEIWGPIYAAGLFHHLCLLIKQKYRSFAISERWVWMSDEILCSCFSLAARFSALKDNGPSHYGWRTEEAGSICLASQNHFFLRATKVFCLSRVLERGHAGECSSTSLLWYKFYPQLLQTAHFSHFSKKYYIHYHSFGLLRCLHLTSSCCWMTLVSWSNQWCLVNDACCETTFLARFLSPAFLFPCPDNRNFVSCWKYLQADLARHFTPSYLLST